MFKTGDIVKFADGINNGLGVTTGLYIIDSTWSDGEIAYGNKYIIKDTTGSILGNTFSNGNFIPFSYREEQFALATSTDIAKFRIKDAI